MPSRWGREEISSRLRSACKGYIIRSRTVTTIALPDILLLDGNGGHLAFGLEIVRAGDMSLGLGCWEVTLAYFGVTIGGCTTKAKRCFKIANLIGSLSCLKSDIQ